MRPTQDDGRENQQIKLFGLAPEKGRSNKYTSDASWTHNGKKYLVELKSCDVTKLKISTSRDFGRHKIEDWKINDGFIFSQFRKTEEHAELTGKHIFCTYEQLRPFFDKQIKKQNEGVADRAGLSEWEGVSAILEEHLTPRQTERIKKTFEWGTKLNDPRMKWLNLEEWGTVLDPRDPRKHLRELLTQENK